MKQRSPYTQERLAELRAKHGTTARRKLKLTPKPKSTIKGRWKH